MGLLKMIKNRREDTGGAAGGGRDDVAAHGVALGGGEGVGDDKGAALERRLVGGGPDIVLAGFAAQVETSGDDAFGLEPLADGFLHGVPHVLQVIPDGRAFALLYVLPIGKAFTLDIRKNLGKSGHGIDVLLGLAGGLIGEGTTADTIDGPLSGGIAVGIESLEVHAVGMEGKHLVGLPDDFYRDGCRTVLQGLVGAVAAACGRKTAVEGDTDGMSLRVVGLELKGSSMGRHGVATGGSVAFAIDFLYCFHVMAENLRR